MVLYIHKSIQARDDQANGSSQDDIKELFQTQHPWVDVLLFQYFKSLGFVFLNKSLNASRAARIQKQCFGFFLSLS